MSTSQLNTAESPDLFGDRMKAYEGTESKRYFDPNLPVCIRLDGRSFSVWTKDCVRPYDLRVQWLMAGMTKALVKETGAAVGYTQSDEITLILWNKDSKSQGYFGNRIQKVVSMTSAFASAWFATNVNNMFDPNTKPMALFDSRAWQVPSLTEAANVLLWRELDAQKNSVSMAAQAVYHHLELVGKNTETKKNMLLEKGIDWNDYPCHSKRGVYFMQHTETYTPSSIELENLPEKHNARTNPNFSFERSFVKQVDISPLISMSNSDRVEIFFGK